MRKYSSNPGRAGRARRLGRPWVGWAEHIAHPDSPMGAGGLGVFSRRSPIVDDSDHADPWTRGGERPVDTLSAPPAPRPPPVTQPRDLGTLKQAESSLLDVRVDAKIVRDGRGGVETGAVTHVSRVASSSPGYVTDSDGNITRFNGKFRWRGTITVQTRYASDSRPEDPSCYGRGTTVADRQSGRITLGFHESCHRADYVAYLQGHPFPDPPALVIGMAEENGPPPPAGNGATRGAVSLHVMPKGACSLGDVWIDFPETANGHPVTATSHDVLSEDRKRDAEGRDVKVGCQWLSTEEPIRAALGFSAFSDTDGRHLSMTAVLSSEGPMPSRLVFRRSSPEPQWRSPTGSECLFSPITVDLSAQSVWGSFVCPTRSAEARHRTATAPGAFSPHILRHGQPGHDGLDDLG